MDKPTSQDLEQARRAFLAKGGLVKKLPPQPLDRRPKKTRWHHEDLLNTPIPS